MGKIRTISKDVAWDLHDKLQAEGQIRFINWVMKEEEVDWEMACAICTGRAEPREPEYTLGYKLADPMYMMAMNAQASKKKRQQAIENFEKTLEPDELELFRKDVLGTSTAEKFKAALKREKKKKKDP